MVIGYQCDIKFRKQKFAALQFLSSALSLVSTLAAFSQTTDTQIQLLANRIDALSKNQASDAIYLQTSKDIYETEEDVWFKGYILDAQYHTPSVRSKTLFVQLIDDQTNKPVWQEKYEIEKGFVHGHLFLNDSLQTGRYTLAAYSSRSFFKNQEDFFAIRKLQVVASIKNKIPVQEQKKDSSIHFQTYPEGGNLVSGILQKVAFKAVDSDGLPINFSGTLFENGKPLRAFKSTHAGMGYFVFLPDVTKTYSVQLNAPYDEKMYSLPEIHPIGKTVQLLSNTDNELIFRISKSTFGSKEKVYLRFQVRGKVYSVAKGFLSKELKIKIPTDGIPQGIAEVTLFDTDLNPVATRLVYTNPRRKINIQTTLDKVEYNMREEVTLHVKTTDDNNRPISAHLGLSLHDWLYQNPQDSKSILSHYYLTSQIKGSIYDPEYYFQNDTKKSRASLDLLLLTQGWSTYIWNNENIRQYPKIKAIASDSLVGYLKSEKYEPNVEMDSPKFVIAFAADTLREKEFIQTENSGKFWIDHTHFKIGENGYVYLKPMAAGKSKYLNSIRDTVFTAIERNRKKMATWPTLSNETEALSQENVLTFMTSKKPTALDEVVVTDNFKRVFRDKYIGTLDSLANIDRIPDYLCLRGILNCPNHPRTDVRPVNGSSYEQFISGKLTRVTYVRNPRKTYTAEELLVLFNVSGIKGYYGERQFYESIYDEINIDDPFPDTRNTLIWKPDIVTDENGEATITFFTSDTDTLFKGRIEGVSYSGLLGTQNFELTVTKE